MARRDAAVVALAVSYDSVVHRLLLLVALAGCPASRNGKGTGPGNEATPPAPPAGSRFLCDRAPAHAAITWRDCQLTDRPLTPKAFCYTARAAGGNGRIHSICAPTESDCRLWHDERDRERHDVVDPCVPLRAHQTGSLDGSPPPRDAQFLCETKPDPRRMVTWRDCKVVDAVAQPAAHCFVTTWRGGRHSVCAPTEPECREWASRRAAEMKDVVAPCKLARPADYWPLPGP